jgi:hypothetical protein
MQIALSPACFEGVDEDEVEEGCVGIPHTVTYDPRLTLSAKGLLMQLISLKGEFDIEAEKRAELNRRAQGIEPEDLDELLAELAGTGWITLPEA